MKRTAQRAAYVASLSEVPKAMATICETSAPANAAILEEFSCLGVSYSKAMLEAVHRVARHRLPSGKALRDWESAALKLMREVKMIDPLWFDQWSDLEGNQVAIQRIG
jgi:hypothetical protein